MRNSPQVNSSHSRETARKKKGSRGVPAPSAVCLLRKCLPPTSVAAPMDRAGGFIQGGKLMRVQESGQIWL